MLKESYNIIVTLMLLDFQLETLPQPVNPEIHNRIQTGMIDKLRLRHLESLRHPVQELQVSPEVKVDKALHKGATTGRTAS